MLLSLVGIMIGLGAILLFEGLKAIAEILEEIRDKLPEPTSEKAEKDSRKESRDHPNQREPF